jgi:hypothetical protein
MAKKGRQTGSRRAGPPKIQNILDIGSTFEPGTLIHFTAAQWEQMTAKIPIGKGVPKFGVAFGYYPIPDGMLAEPMCIQNACEICRSKVTGFGPGGVMTFECQCRRDPACPDGGGGGGGPVVVTPLCRIQIQRVRGMLTIGCASQGCTGQCRLSAVRQGTQQLLVCRCS